MKKDMHPKGFRQVIFEDVTAGTRFLIGSTVRTSEKAKWEDGTEYDLYKVEISSASHPIYTGKMKDVGGAGRGEKFRARQAAAKKTK